MQSTVLRCAPVSALKAQCEVNYVTGQFVVLCVTKATTVLVEGTINGDIMWMQRLRSSLKAAGPRREEDRSDIRVTVVEMHSGVGFKSVLEIQHHCLNGPFDTSGADSHHRYE